MNKQKFKETEIGKIPKEWKAEKIIEIFNVYGGTTPSTSNDEFWNGEIPWVTPTDITRIKNGIYLNKTEKSITEKAIKECSLDILNNNALLLTTRATIGWIVINKMPVTINQGITALIPKKRDEIYTIFYAYYLQTLKSYLNQLGSGSTFKEISKNSLKNIIIPIVPLEEQKKIAEILSNADQAIEEVNEAITKTERLKKGLMQELLTKGIGHKNFKDTEIGRIPKEWVVVKVGEVAEIHDSKRIPLSKMERSKRKGSYPYCGANGIIDYINDYIFDGEFVLLAEDGGDYNKFGNSTYIMKGKFWVNNHAHILKAMENEITNLFLYYVFNFLNLNFYIVGSTRKKLNQDRMKKILIPCPPLTEQKKIAEILSTVDERIKLLKEKKEKLGRVKKGLMNDLLTGRKRVKLEA